PFDIVFYVGLLGDDLLFQTVVERPHRPAFTHDLRCHAQAARTRPDNLNLPGRGRGYHEWQSIASEARLQGLTVRVSDLIEKRATDAEKLNGYDRADYLIRDHRR
ncbi:MAG: hypothetical protein ACR2M8_10110, partial [Pyrinomonadaceae bacterium]